MLFWWKKNNVSAFWGRHRLKQEMDNKVGHFNTLGWTQKGKHGENYVAMDTQVHPEWKPGGKARRNKWVIWSLFAMVPEDMPESLLKSLYRLSPARELFAWILWHWSIHPWWSLGEEMQASMYTYISTNSYLRLAVQDVRCLLSTFCPPAQSCSGCWRGVLVTQT